MIQALKLRLPDLNPYLTACLLYDLMLICVSTFSCSDRLLINLPILGLL